MLIQRVFIVGCERSGTTLLQALLGANSQIVTFPESHFYDKLFGGRRWRLILGLASRKARPRLKKYLSELGCEQMEIGLSRLALTNRQFSQSFIRLLDTITLKQGKSIWVEKTPGHLYFIDQIEKLVKGANFIHIIRNGPDNVASLYEIGLKYADEWRSNYKSIDMCIRRWIKAVNLSKGYSSKDNHILIRYENLIAEPKVVLEKLCNFIGVPFEEKMLSDYPSVAAQVILDKEPWKATTGRPIGAEKNRKFMDLFNDDQRKYILDNIPKEFQAVIVDVK
jgi:hypothetical protein